MLQLLAWQSQQIHVGSDCCPQADVLRLLEHQPHRPAAFVASADVSQLMGRPAHVSIMAAVVAIYVGLRFMGLERLRPHLRCFTSKEQRLLLSAVLLRLLAWQAQQAHAGSDCCLL